MVIPTSFSTPVLADKYVQNLQTALDTLTWLEFVHPLSRLGVDEEGRTFPLVYKNDGSKKNYNVLFDTDVKSCAYFELDGSVGFSDGNFSGGDEDLTIPLSLVVWGRLDKIYPSKKYDYTSELVQDVMNILKYCVNTAGYRINSMTGVNYSVDYNDVFGRYSSYTEQDWLATMRNRTAFRVNFTLNVDSTCDLQEGTSPVVVSTSFNGVTFVPAVAVDSLTPTQFQIASDIGFTASEAGVGYTAIIEIVALSAAIQVVSNGSFWYYGYVST